MPTIFSKPIEARRRAWNRFSFTAIGRNQCSAYFDFGFLVPRTV
jgi:hypothetical protein